MASRAFPGHSKLLTIDIGHGTVTYGYAYWQAHPCKPTFLLLHGFPSSSYDWRHQAHDLQNAGYGVVVPDLLGYGDTDKPSNVEAYTFDKMSAHLTKILDYEGLREVIGVSHDWGGRLLSALVHRYSERFSGLVFLTLPYSKPNPVFDIGMFTYSSYKEKE
jgi:pimeloyl-ACP methyl ester carboxylesterase